MTAGTKVISACNSKDSAPEFYSGSEQENVSVSGLGVFVHVPVNVAWHPRCRANPCGEL